MPAECTRFDHRVQTLALSQSSPTDQKVGLCPSSGSCPGVGARPTMRSALGRRDDSAAGWGYIISFPSCGCTSAVSCCVAVPIKQPFTSWSKTARSGRLPPDAVQCNLPWSLCGGSTVHDPQESLAVRANRSASNPTADIAGDAKDVCSWPMVMAFNEMQSQQTAEQGPDMYRFSMLRRVQ